MKIKKLYHKLFNVIVLYFFSLYLFYDELNIIIFGRPRISIILPIYNKEKYLNRSIGSILNQTFKDIEIIAVNDGSTDNSLNMLEDFKNTDSRIKIVNNEKNCGLCYSRAMGLLNSTGEYIMFLEPDDLFEGKDNLEYLYNQYKNTKEDLIIYNYYNVNRKMKRTRCEKYDKTLTQPEIFEIAFSNYKVHDELIWNKIIKRKLLLKICKLLKKFIMGEKWNHHEDHVWSLLSHKLAKSMRCVDKIAYIYEKNNQSITRNVGSVLELKNYLNRQEALHEIIFDKNREKYLFNSINGLISRIKNNSFFLNLTKSDEEIKFRTIKLISDFINRYENKTLNIKGITSFLDIIV